MKAQIKSITAEWMKDPKRRGPNMAVVDGDMLDREDIYFPIECAIQKFTPQFNIHSHRLRMVQVEFFIEPDSRCLFGIRNGVPYVFLYIGEEPPRDITDAVVKSQPNGGWDIRMVTPNELRVLLENRLPDIMTYSIPQ